MTKTARRPQAQKPVRTRSSVALSAQVDFVSRQQRLATDYRRKPKHVNRGWDE